MQQISSRILEICIAEESGVLEAGRISANPYQGNRGFDPHDNAKCNRGSDDINEIH
jgi:hypothetical protein